MIDYTKEELVELLRKNPEKGRASFKYLELSSTSKTFVNSGILSILIQFYF